MKRIGILFGGENSFPGALVERINARNLNGIQAEFLSTGTVRLDQPPRYAVILDRISHLVPFYRAYLKHAALGGSLILNNPFLASAADKFAAYALAAPLGVAVPPTVLLPHKQLPPGVSDHTLRNLEFPLDWEAVFAAVGEHGFLKPIDGGGGRDVHEVRSHEEFFRAYDQSRDLCLIYQKAVDFSEYFRCYVVGQKKVRVMAYDPLRPHAERYLDQQPQCAKTILKRMERDAVTLSRALGYDFNTVEFGVEKGIPYAIDFLNPVPDADVHSIGQANFDWIVEEAASLLVAKAKAAPLLPEPQSAILAGTAPAKAANKKPAKKKAPPSRKALATPLMR
jgi:hypothetical protein